MKKIIAAVLGLVLASTGAYLIDSEKLIATGIIMLFAGVAIGVGYPLYQTLQRIS